MSKYDLDFKLSVIKHYQSGIEGFNATARRFDIPTTCVREWFSAYEHNGLEGLTHRPGRYPAEFKKLVIQHKQQKHLSIRETAALFNIPSFSMIRAWEKRYDEGGIHSLTDNRGRKKRMSKPPRPPASKPLEEMSQEEMLAELEYLRAENAYLKKLSALIQQKEASASKKRRDSSVN